MIDRILTFRGTLAIFVVGVILMASGAMAQSITSNGTLQNKLLVGGGYDDDMKGDSSKSSGGVDTGKASVGSQTPSDTFVSECSGSDGMAGDVSSENMSSDFFNEADKKEAVISRQLYETIGYIGNNLKDITSEVVNGEPSNQNLFSTSETVYINLGEADGASVGMRYLAYHAEPTAVKHPVTNNKMGYKVLVDGVLEVVEVAENISKCIIVVAYDGIERGEKVQNMKISKYLRSTQTVQ